MEGGRDERNRSTRYRKVCRSTIAVDVEWGRGRPMGRRVNNGVAGS